MQCPRCQSERIQRDYDDASVFLRAVGMHKLLCNNCGLVFKGFDREGKFQRAPQTATGTKTPIVNRRRGPRVRGHLPAAISLIEGDAQIGKVSYSQPSRGHCETISEFGMLLSLVGTRIPEGELSRKGRLLFVRVELPDGSIEAVVKIISYERATEGQKLWQLGVQTHHMSEADKAVLTAYLERRLTGG